MPEPVTRHIREFSLDFFSLAGKRAIVTGGNRGLGQAYAVAMAKAGADFIPTIADDDGTTGELIAAEGRRCEIVTADRRSRVPAEVVRVCRHRRCHIVVNNAASASMSTMCVRPGRGPDGGGQPHGRARDEPLVASTFIEQGSGKIITVSRCSFLGGQRSPAYAQRSTASPG